MQALRNWRAELAWVVAIACVATLGTSQNASAQFSCDDQPLYTYYSDINLCLAPGANCYLCNFRGEVG